MTSSGIGSMCVKAVAQPNGLLFHHSYFQDTMVCFYWLITSLLEVVVVVLHTRDSLQESATASHAIRTPCVQVGVEHGTYAVKQ